MIDGKKVLAIIPARGGSKGLPKKNIRILNGKPLIGWPVQAAHQSKYIDRIIVSTDNEEIAEIAMKEGAEVPFLRPKELASDTATSISVINHGIEFLENAGESYDYVVLLEPTSPLTTAEDIDRALETLASKRMLADSIVGVSEVVNCHPAFDVELDDQGIIKPFYKTFEKAGRRQDLEKLYFFEGSLYISDVKTLKSIQAFYHSRTLGYIVPKWKSFEIDDVVDLICVEAIMKNLSVIEK